MTTADQPVESAADTLEGFVREARRSGGVKAPTDAPTPSAPSGPQLARPKRKNGLNPWAVVGAALAGGYVLAKVLDWRGHAHPDS